MMAYEGFADWYDSLNHAADYDGLCAQLLAQLRANGVKNGIVADLGCGTGEVSIRLAKAGYTVLAVDASADMLSVLRQKLDDAPGLDITLLCQDIAELDLYGTIRAAVSTFDTFNHLTQAQLEQAFARISLFSEPGAVLLFDTNTIYKHKTVLAGHVLEVSGPGGLVCEWANRFNTADNSVNIALTGTKNDRVLFRERFTERAWPPAFWQQLLEQNGFAQQALCDGETFGPVAETSQRYLFTAVKR